MHCALKQLGLAVALALATVGAAWADPYDPADEPRAQMLTLRYEFGGGQPQQFLANGVRLTAPPASLQTMATEKEESDWGVSAGTVILALGVALAVVVLAAGHSADNLNDGKSENGDEGGDNLCATSPTGCGVGVGG